MPLNFSACELALKQYDQISYNFGTNHLLCNIHSVVVVSLNNEQLRLLLNLITLWMINKEFHTSLLL